MIKNNPILAEEIIFDHTIAKDLGKSKRLINGFYTAGCLFAAILSENERLALEIIRQLPNSYDISSELTYYYKPEKNFILVIQNVQVSSVPYLIIRWAQY